MTGFEWIGAFARWAVAWVPRLVHVQANEAGVKFVRARAAVIEPGLHWYWPVTTSTKKTETARCILELDTQPLVTSDGKVVLAGGVVAYRVTDVFKFLVENYDADTNLGEAAEVAIRQMVVGKTFVELQENNRKTVDNALTKEVQAIMNDFGVEVLFARLAELAPARVLYLAGPQPGRVATRASEEKSE